MATAKKKRRAPGATGEKAKRDYLKRMAELDRIAAKKLASGDTKATASAMLVRERREIATHVARVHGVDVDGKLIAPKPIEPGDDTDTPIPGLTIDLSRLPAEMRAEILKHHAEKVEPELAN